VGETTIPGAGARPRVGEDPGASESFRPRVGETPPPPMSGAHDSSYRQPSFRAPEQPLPADPVPAAPPAPKVRLARTVQLPDPNVEGQVVRGDGRSPQAHVRPLLVNSERGDQHRSQ